MFSFFRKKLPVPEWAGFFSSKEYAQFLAALDKYFTPKNVAHTVEDGMVNLPTVRFGGRQLGLTNLAQNCRQMSSDKWQEMVTQHFDQMERIQAFDKEFSARQHDYDKIRDFLGVRLYDKDYLSHLPENKALIQPVTDDIMAVLVFDLPHGIKSINGENIGQWNQTAEELFKTGIANIKRNYEFEMTSVTIGDDKCWSVENDHFFSTNIIMDLKNYPQVIGKYGTIVGVPNRHTVLLYNVENLVVFTTIHTLIEVVSSLNYKGPGSISPCIYWYYNDTFTTIPYSIADNQIIITPPENFGKILNILKNDVGERN